MSGSQVLAGQAQQQMAPRVVVLIPCYNEAPTIAQTVTAFRGALPQATVYVYDNNSSDRSGELAREAGAIVQIERRQGKGEVVRRMFADIEADMYVLVDGDATYDAGSAPAMVEMMRDEKLDFLNGARRSESLDSYRRGHRLGNAVLTQMVRMIFGRQFTDMLSGYKLFSRRFVKSFPSMSRGFEIETELSVHALELRMPCAEVDTAYFERPEGSFSKLNTYRDGARILWLIVSLIKNERPLHLFGIFGGLLIVAAVAISAPLVMTYLATGLVPRLPTAVLAMGLVTVGVLSMFTGLILDMVTTMRHEMKRLAYLRVPLPF